jgi:hypothetical protein
MVYKLMRKVNIYIYIKKSISFVSVHKCNQIIASQLATHEFKTTISSCYSFQLVHFNRNNTNKEYL